MSALLLLVPLAPLTAALLARLVGLRVPRASGWIAASGTIVALLVLLLDGHAPRVETTWFQVGHLVLTVGVQLDGLAWVMTWLVAAVGLLVTVYAVAFMAEDRRQPAFFATFAFFIGAMLALVLADSFVLLFAAWEFVGLASFLLIGFWHTEADARRAAQRAFLLTRLGDLGLLLGWLLALQLVGSTDIAALLDAVPRIAPATLTLLALLFFAGAVGKSAQLPLTAWLPDAMAGPAPVSALLHSATMVAAGVYLVLRLFPLFAAAPGALTMVLWLGGATALVAALTASAQTDLKRVLAWSTVSQLGEMFLALGLAGPVAAALHLAAHAVFKATLFLAAGAVDHVTGTRDLRRLGGLWRAMPFTAVAFGVAALALAGVPPLAGFWSEDAVLAQAAAAGVAPAALLLLLIFLAGVYISRAGVATFARWPGTSAPDAHEPPWLMRAPMLLLALGALSLGALLHGALAVRLDLPAAPELALPWRGGALLASMVGLAFGALRVLRRGPVPAFGSAPLLLARGLDQATNLVEQAAWACAHALDRLERVLDRGAHGIGTTIFRFAHITAPVEHLLDSNAHALARATLRLGQAAETGETRGFAAAGDWFAALLGHAGGQVRRAETGKVYMYTLGLVVWLLVVGVVAGLLFWR